MHSLEINLNRIRQRISIACASVGRDVSSVTLVAVSKTVGVEAVQAAVKLGVTDFGENRVSELVHKRAVVPDVRWHMIGRLQTNKVKEVVDKAYLIHSLDRWNLAEALQKRADILDITIPVLLQVNIAGEEQKAGVHPDEVLPFLQSIDQLPRIKIMGLMTMAPLSDDPEHSRPIFRELAQMRKQLQQYDIPNVSLRHLSMGMSQDFEVAIQEGADLVRIGSSLFQNNS
ncbi:MAG TPA: YggS family pyridoxal phosphate-dependent enzyme [Syntrophomonadaceae bacterium]|nr:YggS family pyridoxal phosphate-dependent enzyme [Syntrophomonadaceae bacterium]HQE22561.1 YggS family pyridoxal phosphate-dependent enzyme [Syntrophomonadaceae bacterium]